MRIGNVFVCFEFIVFLLLYFHYFGQLFDFCIRVYRMSSQYLHNCFSDSRRRLLSFPEMGSSTGHVGRRLLDVYGDSLLHVNRIYNREYGHVPRMVVSHIPHLVDKNVFGEMRRKFSTEWRRTSQHRLRQSDDMQFAFAYFHYLMSETRDFDPFVVFQEFDTDNSDTWSDREIRTLLTRIYDLPLTLNYIKSFEKLIVDCAADLKSYNVPSSTPSFERYFDSDLPIVSSDLVNPHTIRRKF